MFTMYDAIPAAMRNAQGKAPMDNEIDKFLPMLEDYLKSKRQLLCDNVFTLIMNYTIQ